MHIEFPVRSQIELYLHMSEMFISFHFMKYDFHATSINDTIESRFNYQK